MNNLILVFDVETNGLIPKGEPILDLCPYILQLSFIVYDVETHKILQKYNNYINVNSKVKISAEIEKLTGITRAKCNGGVVIVEALNALYEAYMKCSTIIAHNIEFDSKMIRIELARNPGRKTRHLCDLLNSGYEKEHNKLRYCTMQQSLNMCNIMVDAIDKQGKPYQYKKFPKLSELYEKLFKHNDKLYSIFNELIDFFMFDKKICYKLEKKSLSQIGGKYINMFNKIKNNLNNFIK